VNRARSTAHLAPAATAATGAATTTVPGDEPVPPAAPAAVRRVGVGPARWLANPVVDVALALSWVPFALVAHVLQGRAPDLLPVFVGAVFLLSFAHQPLTLGLVYGDAEQHRAHPALFRWSPLVFFVAVVVGLEVSLVALAVVGGLWNAEHTLMQRYGLVRIYGRKAGQQDGRLERALLLSWLALALVWVAADPGTPDRLRLVDLGENNTMAIEQLAGLRAGATWILPLALGAAVALAAVWARTEWRDRSRANPAKWCYVASTAALFVVVLVDPLAGLLGYVGSHAVEYLVVVHHRLGHRYVSPATSAPGDERAGEGTKSLLGRAVRARPGPLGVLALYLVLVAAVVVVLERVADPWAYGVVFFTLGGLHVFYDGFIWKLRRPPVAAGLALPTGH
jgi:hypothetical protein